MRKALFLIALMVATAGVTAACSDRGASRSPTMPPALDGNDTTCRGGGVLGGGSNHC